MVRRGVRAGRRTTAARGARRRRSHRGEYTATYLAVSHRWLDAVQPDADGAQQRALQGYLRAHPEIEYVWFEYACSGSNSGLDGVRAPSPWQLTRQAFVGVCVSRLGSYWSMPQGKRTPAETEQFRWMLQNANVLYLGARVLILLDLSYLSRLCVRQRAACANAQRAPTRSVRAHSLFLVALRPLVRSARPPPSPISGMASRCRRHASLYAPAYPHLLSRACWCAPADTRPSVMLTPDVRARAWEAAGPSLRRG